jgi:hypothetical protein
LRFNCKLPPSRLFIASALLSLAACEPYNTVSEGPLAKSRSNEYFRFSDAPALQPGKGDALRIFVQPSFGMYHYRFDFVPMDKGCNVAETGRRRSNDEKPEGKECGHTLVLAERWLNSDNDDRRDKATQFKFVVPAPEFTEFYNVLKKKLAASRGSNASLTDGTSTGIELHSHGRVSSYRSNVPLDYDIDDPAAYAALHMRVIAMAYGPSGMFPREPGWNVRRSDEDVEEKFRCSDPGVNEPDADGYGIGDDACARSLDAGLR